MSTPAGEDQDFEEWKKEMKVHIDRINGMRYPITDDTEIIITYPGEEEKKMIMKDFLGPFPRSDDKRWNEKGPRMMGNEHKYL